MSEGEAREIWEEWRNHDEEDEDREQDRDDQRKSNFLQATFNQP